MTIFINIIANKYKDGKLNTNCIKDSKLNKEITINHAENTEYLYQIVPSLHIAVVAIQNQWTNVMTVVLKLINRKFSFLFLLKIIIVWKLLFTISF